MHSIKASPFQSTFDRYQQPRVVSVVYADAAYVNRPRFIHQHDDRLELVFIDKGWAHHVIDHQAYEVAQGDVLVYSAGLLHEEYIEVSEDLEVYVLAFDRVFVQGLPENHLLPLGQQPLIKTLDDIGVIRNLFVSIYQHMMVDEASAYELAQYLGRSLLLYIRRMAVGQTERDQKTATDLGLKIKQWIDAHYKEDITLKQIGQALYLNPYYIAHVFKSFSGISPMQYVSRRRIGESQSLLTDTNMPISEVAASVGYSSNSLFTRTFNQVVGCSPNAYRKKMHRKI